MPGRYILVVSEPNCTGNHELNYELIGKANELAVQNGAQVLTVIIDKEEKNNLDGLKKYGAKKIIFYPCNQKKTYAFYADIVIRLCNRYRPELVLFPGTVLGKGISATAATDLGAGLIADCIDIQTDDNRKYLFARAAMNSQIIAKIVCVDACIQMCTVKKNVFQSSVRVSSSADTKIEILKTDIADSYEGQLQLLSKESIDMKNSVDLENAKIIIGAGRGVRAGDIDRLKELSGYWGAEYAATRVLVEEGILPKNRQIGQSGISVKPVLYIAFGISGASQHMVGLKNAKKIVAINKDSNAPIFGYADYAIVADTHEVIEKAYLRMKGDAV